MVLDYDKIKTLLDELETAADDAESAADEARGQARDVVDYTESASARAGELREAAEKLNAVFSEETIGEMLEAREKVQELQQQRDNAATTLKCALKDLGLTIIEAKDMEAIKAEADTRKATDAEKIRGLEEANARLVQQLEALKALIKVEPQRQAVEEGVATAAD